MDERDACDGECSLSLVPGVVGGVGDVVVDMAVMS